MKRILIFILTILLLTALSTTVYAADNGDSSSAAITIIIPQSEPEKDEPTEPTPKKLVQYLYPTSVKETQDENGKREIVKTYELAANEKPDNISRESFIIDGWLYELTDITKKETDSTDTRQHTETITLDTETKDMDVILKQLALTMDYKASDGYFGVLSLDISGIKVETAGTKTSSYTVTATREYPHLSSNDTSVIPKSITENGRTLTLSDIQWRTQNTVTIDYDQLPDSYTATATYTGTAYRTIVTGYVTTAEYTGELSKTIKGKTVYKAYFNGVPIITVIPDTTEATTEPEITTEELEFSVETDTADDITTDEITPLDSGFYDPLILIIIILETAGLSGLITYHVIERIKQKKEKGVVKTI